MMVHFETSSQDGLIAHVFIVSNFGPSLVKPFWAEIEHRWPGAKVGLQAKTIPDIEASTGWVVRYAERGAGQ
jgi:hypothetical protein